MLRVGIKHAGQRYVDEPKYLTVEPKNKIMQNAVARAFGSKPLKDIRILTHYERVQLRWMKPDGHGGLVPKLKGNK